MSRLAAVVLAAGLLTACGGPDVVEGGEDCAIRYLVELTDAPVADSPTTAVQAAVDSGDLELADGDLEVLLEQLDGLPAGDTPVFVGIEGRTVTIAPTADAWQVTELESITDC